MLSYRLNYSLLHRVSKKSFAHDLSTLKTSRPAEMKERTIWAASLFYDRRIFVE
jgi:hypothetical protein